MRRVEENTVEPLKDYEKSTNYRCYLNEELEVTKSNQK